MRAKPSDYVECEIYEIKWNMIKFEKKKASEQRDREKKLWYFYTAIKLLGTQHVDVCNPKIECIKSSWINPIWYVLFAFYRITLILKNYYYQDFSSLNFPLLTTLSLFFVLYVCLIKWNNWHFRFKRLPHTNKLSIILYISK